MERSAKPCQGDGPWLLTDWSQVRIPCGMPRRTFSNGHRFTREEPNVRGCQGLRLFPLLENSRTDYRHRRMRNGCSGPGCEALLSTMRDELGQIARSNSNRVQHADVAQVAARAELVHRLLAYV